MTYFLKDQRRRRLIDALVCLTMPAQQATQLASLPDDLHVVDWSMASCSMSAIDRAEQIIQIGRVTDIDINRLHTLSCFLAADLIVMEAYRNEAIERNCLRDFSAWLEVAFTWRLQ